VEQVGSVDDQSVGAAEGIACGWHIRNRTRRYDRVR
jgi:hypothetical protein